MQKREDIKSVVFLISLGIILIVSVIILMMMLHRREDDRLSFEDYSLLSELNHELSETSLDSSWVHFVSILCENDDVKSCFSRESAGFIEQLSVDDGISDVFKAFETEKKVKLLVYNHLDNVLQEKVIPPAVCLFLSKDGYNPIIIGIQHSGESLSRVVIVLWIVLVLIILMVLYSVVLVVRRVAMIQRREDYVNFMAHEMKTPIAAMALIGQSFLDDDVEKDEEWVKTFGDAVVSENEKLRLLVEEMLRYARGNEMLHLINKNVVDLHEIILEGARDVEKQIEARAGCLKLELAAENSFVMGDSFHLLNVMLNLIGNAVKYQGGSPWVGVETYNEGDKIVVRVMDKGEGIPKSEQKKVFEKFYRIKNAQTRVSSHGLGLYYVKTVIKNHGGDIKILNLENFGTVFVFILPIANQNQIEPKSY